MSYINLFILLNYVDEDYYVRHFNKCQAGLKMGKQARKLVDVLLIWFVYGV